MDEMGMDTSCLTPLPCSASASGMLSRKCHKARLWATLAAMAASVTRPASIAAPSTASNRSRRSEEHTSELQSLMRISYAVLCLKNKTNPKTHCKHETTKQLKITKINEYN